VTLFFRCPLVIYLGRLSMSRVPPTTSESGKNASGHEVFGSKVPGSPVVESPTTLAADMTSTSAVDGVFWYLACSLHLGLDLIMELTRH
jgi:hypothetical protein